MEIQATFPIKEISSAPAFWRNERSVYTPVTANFVAQGWEASALSDPQRRSLPALMAGQRPFPCLSLGLCSLCRDPCTPGAGKGMRGKGRPLAALSRSCSCCHTPHRWQVSKQLPSLLWNLNERAAAKRGWFQSSSSVGFTTRIPYSRDYLRGAEGGICLIYSFRRCIRFFQSESGELRRIKMWREFPGAKVNEVPEAWNVGKMKWGYLRVWQRIVWPHMQRSGQRGRWAGELALVTTSSLELLLPFSSLDVNGMFSPVVKQTRLRFDDNFPHCSRPHGEMHFQTALVQEYRVIGLQEKWSRKIKERPQCDSLRGSQTELRIPWLGDPTRDLKKQLFNHWPFSLVRWCGKRMLQYSSLCRANVPRWRLAAVLALGSLTHRTHQETQGVSKTRLPCIHKWAASFCTSALTPNLTAFWVVRLVCSLSWSTRLLSPTCHLPPTFRKKEHNLSSTNMTAFFLLLLL